MTALGIILAIAIVSVCCVFLFARLRMDADDTDQQFLDDETDWEAR